MSGEPAGAGMGAGAQPTTQGFSLFVRLPNSKSVAVATQPGMIVGDVVQEALSRSDFNRLTPAHMLIELGGRLLQPGTPLKDVGAGHMSTLRLRVSASIVPSECQAMQELERLARYGHPFPEEGSAMLCVLCNTMEGLVKSVKGSWLQPQAVAHLRDSQVLQSLARLACHATGTDAALFGRDWLAQLVACVLSQLQLAAEKRDQSETVGQMVSACVDALLGSVTPLLTAAAAERQWDKGVRLASSILRHLVRISATCPLSRLPAPRDAAKRNRASQPGDEAPRTHLPALVDCLEVSVQAVARCECSLPCPGDGAAWAAQLGSRGAGTAIAIALHDAACDAAALLCDFYKAASRNWQKSLSSNLRSAATLRTHITRCLEALLDVRTAGRAGETAAHAAAVPWLARLLCTLGQCLKASETVSTRRAGANSLCALQDAVRQVVCHPEAQALLAQPECRNALSCARGMELLTHPTLRSHFPLSLRLWTIRYLADQEDTESDLDEDDEDEVLLISRDPQLIVETSFAELLPLRPAQLNSMLAVRFAEEPGQGGGVTREWLSLLIPKLFSPDLGLFIRCAGDPLALFPSPSKPAFVQTGMYASASVHEGHLQYLSVAGRVMGLALLHGVPLGFRLAAAFYRGIEGWDGTRPLFDDLHELDPQMWRSCLEVLNAEDASELCLDFTVSYDQLGKTHTAPLSMIPDDPVTNANREEYVEMVAQYLLRDCVKEELQAVREGLLDVLKVPPSRFLSLEAFNEVALGSLGAICPHSWRLHTQCVGWVGWTGGAAAQRDEAPGGAEQAVAEVGEPPVLRWFWFLVGAMTAEQRTALLRFWTSLPCLPQGGFAALPLVPRIVRAQPSTQPLPLAHTCFFELSLPDYEDVFSLSAGLREALAAAEGFSME